MTPTDPTTPADNSEFHMGAFKAMLRSVRPGRLGRLGLPDHIVDNEIVPQVEAAIKQARRDTFDLVRDALQEGHGRRDPHARWEFLQYCLTGWVECGHHGFYIHKYDSGVNGHDLLYGNLRRDKQAVRREAKIEAIEVGDDELSAEDVARVLKTPDPDYPVFAVTHETIELGLSRIRDAVDMPDTGTGNWESGLTSISGLGRSLRNTIIEADLTNEASQLDVWGYTAIVEIALLNESRYA